MATAAATPVQTNQQIEQEIRELERQTFLFGPKLRADEEKLASLVAAETQVAEAIVRGEEKPERAAQTKTEMEGLRVRIEGARSIISKSSARLGPLHRELGRRQEEVQKAARLKQFQDLQTAAREKLREITDQIVSLSTGPMAQFDDIRDRLERDFADLSGKNPAVQIRDELSGSIVMPGTGLDPGEHASRRLVSELLDVDGVPLVIRQPRFSGWRRGGVIVPVCSMRPPKI